jgi:membrane protein DedA with SNARE-associated domain
MGDASLLGWARTSPAGGARHGSARPWTDRHRAAAVLLGVVGLLLALVPSIALLVEPDLTDPLGEFSYAGVFLVNVVSTATLFFPVPGVTTAANVLIVTEGSDARFPWLVGLAGGAGMAAGEITAYAAGRFGAHVTRTQGLRLPARLEAPAERVAAFVRRMMARWGALTLFVLAAIPDPVFEVAAVTAGSMRMPLPRYFAAVSAGCIVRGVSLAYLGSELTFLT